MQQTLMPRQPNEPSSPRNHTRIRDLVGERVRAYLVTLSRYLPQRIPVDESKPVNLLPNKPGNHIEDSAKGHYTESLIEPMSMALPAIINCQRYNGSFVEIRRQPATILARNSRSHL